MFLKHQYRGKKSGTYSGWILGIPKSLYKNIKIEKSTGFLKIWSGSAFPLEVANLYPYFS